MSQKKQDINVPKVGMTEKHLSQLREGEYPFALNTNVEHNNGNGFPLLQNEPSNILCSNFKEGYKVIGVQKDVTNNRTFFFLVNPTTGCSEIGYVPNINNITTQTDAEQECDCDINVKLATPLEDQEESEVCEYTILINDCICEQSPPSPSLDGNKCLNFNVKYPISTEIKEEKCGTVIYFTDDLNPRRRFEVDNIEQYYVDEEECNESDVDCDCGIVETTVCINCEKLLLQKPFKVPCIDVKGLVNGGNLKHGVYEFYVAYTDGNGNEVTRYMAVTGEVFVKDPNKNIYQQPELDSRTNYSIKLKINNLDEDYQFYKIAVKQITSVDFAVSFFDVGTFPITSNEIIYSGGEANLLRTSANQIMNDYPIYTKAKTVQQFNNYLSFSDLETIPEVNLQPVMNLAGQFLRWRTSVAEENLYASAEAGAKYRSYLRDEVEPFSIRFFTKSGYVTALFPLIGRVATDEDCLFEDWTLDEQIEEINFLSITDLDELEEQEGWRGVTTNSFKINSTGASFEVDGAVQYTFPLADGTVGQALITDGNGALSWGGSGNGLIIQGSDNMYPAENIPPNIDLDFATANLIIGVDSAPNLTTESNNIYLGSYIDGSSTESIAIGNSTVVTGLQSIAIGHTSSANHDSSVVFSGGASTAANQLIFAQAGEVFFRVGADILINGGWSAAGTNVSGHNLVLAGGRGTGNATSGGLLFQTPDAGASGSTRQSLTEKMRLTNGGDLVIDLATKGLVLKDTQGTPHYWRVTISTLGVLTTTDLGTTIPT